MQRARPANILLACCYSKATTPPVMPASQARSVGDMYAYGEVVQVGKNIVNQSNNWKGEKCKLAPWALDLVKKHHFRKASSSRAGARDGSRRTPSENVPSCLGKWGDRHVDNNACS